MFDTVPVLAPAAAYHLSMATIQEPGFPIEARYAHAVASIAAQQLALVVPTWRILGGDAERITHRRVVAAREASSRALALTPKGI